jgi:hypothetical protein
MNFPQNSEAAHRLIEGIAHQFESGAHHVSLANNCAYPLSNSEWQIKS